MPACFVARLPSFDPGEVARELRCGMVWDTVCVF